MEMQDKGRPLVQTLKRETLEVKHEEFLLEEVENTIGCVAKLKTDNDPFDYESFDKCERNVKMEAVFFVDKSQEIAETEEQKVPIKPETEDDRKVIVDSLPIGDCVNDDIDKGMCYL